ncbi:MAG: hypothetical protein ACI8S6_000214 [Myxococcota bacterium]|jgi:hypothetical protein
MIGVWAGTGLLGCQPDGLAPVFSYGTIGTVVTVSWESEVAGSGAVVVETDTDTLDVMAQREALGDGLHRYSATLIGLRSSTDYVADITTEAGEVVSAPFQSGPLPVALSGLEVTGQPASGGYLLTTLAIEPAGPIIVDRGGGYVWAHADPGTGVLISAARPDPANDAIVYGTFRYNADAEEDTVTVPELVRVSLDGDSVERLAVPGYHHDFAVHDDGTIAYISYDTREHEGVMWPGDQIIERYPDGSEATIWSVWDDIDFDERDTERGPGWTHANALDYVYSEDAYYLSLHNLSSVLKIDRATGELDWALGGRISDFTHDRTLLLRQHQLQRTDSGLVIFNAGLSGEESAEVLDITLDMEAMTAVVVDRYAPGDGITSRVLGDASRLDGGSTLATFSTAGVIDEVDAAGERVWRLEAGFGSVFGYSQHLADPQALLGD